MAFLYQTYKQLAYQVLFHLLRLPVHQCPSHCHRSKALASQIGAYHLDINIDSVVASVLGLFASITGKTPRFRVDGGSPAENLALQNIQVGAYCRT